MTYEQGKEAQGAGASSTESVSDGHLVRYERAESAVAMAALCCMCDVRSIGLQITAEEA